MCLAHPVDNNNMPFVLLLMSQHVRLSSIFFTGSTLLNSLPEDFSDLECNTFI